MAPWISNAPPAPAAGPGTGLRSAAFRQEREASWRELEALLATIEQHGIRRPAAKDLERLPVLYRGLVSSLSVARAIALDRHLVLYLEDLALRAYLVVYGPRANAFDSLAAFLRRGFPAAVRGARWPLLVATLAMLAGVAAGYLLVAADEDWLTSLVPAELAGDRDAASTADVLRRTEIFAPWPGFTAAFVVFANSLFRHNSLVALMAFGLGAFGGVPTILLMIYQGLTLGAFIALHARRGLLVDFLGWISIHGVTEITAILIAGAGGLVIARHMLFPGGLSRLDALGRYGREAAQLAGGAVLMLFAAGLIEGGFRQLVGTTMGRFAFAAVTAALWSTYFLSGRSKRHG